MLGVYDFCTHYDWTFRWLEEEGGRELLLAYWEEAIAGDSQDHAARLIREKALEGMKEYWGNTLAEESPDGGYRTSVEGDRFLLEMTDCPSRGFLLRNGVDFSGDYCDHCIGWIGPVMKRSGYAVSHGHNHCGQCYWEFRPKGATPVVRLEDWKKKLLADWEQAGAEIDRFEGNSPEDRHPG